MHAKKVFENGVHNISIDDYHGSYGVSRSSLMEFKRSPYHYYYKYLCDNDRAEPTPALIMGNLIHTLVLEPQKFDDEFVIRPEMDRRTTAGKFAFNQFIATLAGRIGVTNEQFDTAHKIAQEIKNNEVAAGLLKDCFIEKSIYFNHASTNIQCKVRPDAWANSIVIDLKTTNDGSFRAFQRSAFSYGYFLQAGMIKCGLQSLGLSLDRFIIIAVEKEPPYAVAVYILDEEAIEFGVNQFNRLMDKYSYCIENSEWLGYGVEVLSIPKYANYDEIEGQDE